jgi:hypothetical protein
MEKNQTTRIDHGKESEIRRIRIGILKNLTEYEDMKIIELLLFYEAIFIVLISILSPSLTYTSHISLLINDD